MVYLRPTDKNLIVFPAAGFINSELLFTEYPAVYRQRLTVIKCDLKILHAMEVHILNTRFASVGYNMHCIRLCAVALKCPPISNFTLSC